MADEILKRDQNFVTVLGGVTDDADLDVTMLRVDPITKRLLVKASGISAGVTSLNGLTGDLTLEAGTGIAIVSGGTTITISSTVTSSQTLADVSSFSITTAKSLYTMTATVPVEFKTSGGTHLLYLNESSAFVGIGTANPDSLLTVSRQNTIQAAVSGTTAHFIGLDANPLRFTLDSHVTGTSGTAFMFRRSRGTSASPSAIASGDTLGSLNALGYGTSQYAAASTGLISFKALEAFTNTAMGTSVNVFTTPIGSVTAAQSAVFADTGLTLGVAGTLKGALLLAGNTSGTITIQPQAAAGTYNFNLPITAGTAGQVATSGGGGASPMTWTTISGSGSAVTIPINNLLAATGTNTINSGTFAQEWQWNTMTGTTSMFKLSSANTDATNHQLFEVALSGATGASNTTYAMRVSNTHTGGGTQRNFAIYAEASGAGSATSYQNVALQAVVGTNKSLVIVAGENPGTISDYSSGTAAIAFSRQTSGFNFPFSISGYQTAGGAKENLLIASRNDVVFASNGTEYARLLDTGDWGFGLTNPTARVQITSAKTTGIGFRTTSSTVTTGNVASFEMTSTSIPTSNNTKAVNISTSGANANNSAAATGLGITVANTGSNSVNYGALISATGASGNASIVADAGIYVGTLTPQLTAGTFLQATPSTTGQKVSGFTGNAINTISALAGANAVLVIEGNGATNNRVGILTLRDNPSTSFAYNVASSVSSLLGAVTFEGFSTTTGTSRLSSYILATVTSVQSTTLSSKLDFFMTNASGTQASRFTIGANGDNVSTQGISTTGSPAAWTVTAAAHTTLTASTEATDVNYNLARTVQFATGTITTQRAFRIQAPTYAFVGASALTTAITMEISGAPAEGTNATITDSIALQIAAGAATGATNAYGLVVAAPTGATTINQAAYFNGFVGIGQTAADVALYVKGTSGGSQISLERTSAVKCYWVSGNTTGLIGTQTNHTFAIFANNTEQVYVASGGFVGIGNAISSPSAALHIKASTSAAGTGSLKLNAGVLLATPEAGVVEFDGTDWYLTI